MNFKVFFRNWIIPPAFYRFMIQLKRTRFAAFFTMPKVASSSLRSPSTSFKGKYSGKRCFILATGPSINAQDLKLLAGEYCIGVGMFHLHPDVKVLKPIWHVLAPSHAPFKFDTLDKIFDTITKRYSSNEHIQFLLGTSNYAYSYDEYLKISGDFLGAFSSRIFSVNYNKSPELNESNYNDENVWDLCSKPFRIRTVIYSAIQLAYFLGFSEIVLIGCDHDYLSDMKRVENHHFYQEADGFSDREHLQAFNTERWFYEYYSRWRDYRLMMQFLASKDVRIVNATEGGMLDVFPRVNLREIVT